jgi:GNAT superfamily N-acetyltransferase
MKARKFLDLLSDKYENIQLHKNDLLKFVDNKNTLIALENGKVVGFLNAYLINEFKGTARGALSMPPLHGILDGYDKTYLYNELYRRAADLWVKNDCYTHCIVFYANDVDVIDNWFMNGFGMFVIDAVRPIEYIILSDYQEGIIFRKAEKGDLVNMIPLFQGIEKHLVDTPIFLCYHESEDYIKEYTDWLEVEGNNLWIAVKDQEFIGYLKTNTSEINLDELNDGKTMAINGAYVLPEYRGNQIMARLVNLAMKWAMDQGLSRCSTDFESANIEGRRFWLRHFIPYAYSMIRRIDERNHIEEKVN